MPTQRTTPTSARRTVRHNKPLAGLPAMIPTAAGVPNAESPGNDDHSRDLARELHDELGSVLTAARLDVAWLKMHHELRRDQWLERLQRLEALLLDGHARLRQVVQGLYPSALEHLGLPAALDMLIKDQAGRFDGRLHCDIAPQAQVEGPAALALYRCAQECLTNLHRHAGATRVALQLARIGDQVELKIVDNGCGFNPAQVGPRHHGLVGMRSRLRAVGGEVQILSQPGAGTQVIARVRAQTAH